MKKLVWILLAALVLGCTSKKDPGITELELVSATAIESAELIEREGMSVWVEQSIGRRLDPEMVDPAHIRWYAEQMKATPAHVVAGFQANASGDIGPMLKNVQTPMLMLAAANLREEVLGDFRGAADLFPNGRKVIFPGVYGFIQHILPVPCARVWLDFAHDLKGN